MTANGPHDEDGGLQSPSVTSEDDSLVDSRPEFRRVRDYLRGKAPPGELPAREHIDPLELPDLLPRIMLIDVVRGSGRPRYRIRLMGSQVVTIQGKDGTGKFVEEVLTIGPDIIAGYDRILESRRPQYRRGVVATPGREHVPYERVAFPLAGDGKTVDMLLFIFTGGL